MCHLCSPPPFRPQTRRSFVCKLAAAVVTVGLTGATRLLRAQPAPALTRAPAGWARLITPNGEWDYHSDREMALVSYLKKDPSINFSGRTINAHPRDLQQLCQSPFLFSFDLTLIRSEQEWANIREYLYRGGFLYLDNCVHVSPDIRAFRRDHLERLTKLLPASEWRRLSPEHPIYRARYPVKVTDLPFDPKTPREDQRAYYGVFDDNRMVALVSMAHLFCSWSQQPKIVPICMKQIANIYHYATTH